MCNNNNTGLENRQGVYYNTEFGRWEYYGKNPVIRAGEPQPNFVSADYQKCITYKMVVEGEK
jgi:hypothetical protein